MQKNHFIAQESFWYSVRKQDLFFYFLYIKTFRKKIGFCIWMKITMTAIIERQRARLYKKQKRFQTFLYTKSQTLFKKLSKFRYVFKYKKQYTWRYGIFMKFLKLEFIYKKHDTLRYVTFLYAKSWTLHKKQDNLRYVFIYKNLALLRYAIFYWIFEICGEGGIYLFKKHCTLRDIFILKNNALYVTLLYTKSLTLSVTF